MSGSGVVDEVFGSTVPTTNGPCRMVLVNRPGAPQVQFAIPADGPAPTYGQAISWGPHHAWWGDQRVPKLTWELDPTAPLR